MLKYKKIIYLSLFFNISFGYAWSWFYSKKIVIPKSKKHEKFFFWTKKDTPSFTQLIFSWNGFRPTKGYYEFWVRGQGAKTKKWYKWHKMFSWGKNLQKSFMSCSKEGTSYYHVRLESPKGRLLSGYSIQVKAFGGASLENLKYIYVNVSNFDKFRPEQIIRKKFNYSSLNLDCKPLTSQMKLDHPDYDSLCSPTSISMLLGFLLKKELNACDIANRVYDNGLKGYGSWALNTAHAFDLPSGKFKFYVKRLSSFGDIYNYLKKSLPVAVSIRGPLNGSALPHKNGHLLLVIGYDKEKQKVICNDPAFPDHNETRVCYNIKDFIRAWERSRRLSYVVEKID